MFLRSDDGIGQGGGAAALSFAPASAHSFGRAVRDVATPAVDPAPLDHFRTWLSRTDWTPDLGARIGSADWWRGLATCTSLIAATCLLSPGFDRPIIGTVPPPLDGAAWEDVRTQSIAPLALGATTGRRLGANDLVKPLADTPERPIVELAATIGTGDRFGRVLERAGVGSAEADTILALVAQTVDPASITPGTQIDLTLGRRASRSVPRPVEALRFRARFDLALAINRVGGRLVATPQPIAIDHTPLRIRGIVGQSLYRSARAAGAPAKAVEAYLRALASRLSVGGDVRPDDVFDIIVERARAATGEVQLGQLLFAGLDQGRRKLQLVRWGESTGGEGRGQWFEASGTGERRGVAMMPVAGRQTSGYGVRFHPILQMMRMHKGIDIGAAYGAPIHAAIDGIVAFAGRNAGYGNFVKLAHGNGLATGYGHMSRIAVSPGTRVTRGQIIGYIGSTGLSTGPHLHYEMWRNGVAINPRSVSFSQVAQLSGDALRAFKRRVAALLAVRTGNER